MADARSTILQRLRSVEVTGRPGGSPEIPVRRFDWTPSECLRRFRERMESARGAVLDVGIDWPRRMFEMLRDRSGGKVLYGPAGSLGPELQRGWPGSGEVRLVPYRETAERCRDDLFGSVDAGFTGCRAGIAETGSLVLWPTEEEPRLLSLVPPIHFVLLDAGAIYTSLHELLVAQSWHAGLPANALLISGPSKSADIEQTLAYGVHGSKELIVFIR